MKTAWILSLVCLFTCLSAQAERVVIRNPIFQGGPIKAGVTWEPRFFSNSRAHMVCRLAGYARAAVKNSDAIYTRRIVSQDNVRLFDTYSIFRTDEGSRQWLYFADMPETTLNYDVPVGLKDKLQPKFKEIRRAHSCAKMAACMDYEVDNMRNERLVDLNPDHPFVRKCTGWGTNSNEPYAFSEVTCETDLAMPWQAKIAKKVAEFHQTTNNQYRVTQGSLSEAGFGIQDIKLCQGNSGYSSSSLYAPRVGTCDYVPKYNRENWILSLMGGDTFEMYLTLSGRLRQGPRVGPSCAQKILEDYTQAVIPNEYGMSPGLLRSMRQPFCVEGISEIKTNVVDGTCSFQVKTRDFLQRTTTINVAYGGEGQEVTAATCEERSRCFGDLSLSCEHANFCPAPGLIRRSQP